VVERSVRLPHTAQEGRMNRVSGYHRRTKYEPVDWEDKRRRLYSEEKMKPLVELMEELREISEGRHVPNFDPDDGGVNAEVLLLFQDPGPWVEKVSDFISEDNHDLTARRVKNIERTTGLDRERTIAWNAVPWQIVNEVKKARKRELKSELKRVKEEKCLTRLLRKFEGHNPRAVALFGKDHVWAFEDEVKEARPGLKIFKTYHPSPIAMNCFPEYRKHFEVVSLNFCKLMVG
jgi:uracil-DNA glycosylase